MTPLARSTTITALAPVLWAAILLPIVPVAR